MGIRLSKKRPAAVDVPIGGGSVIRVRPATQFECDAAVMETQRDLAAIVEGSEAAARLAPLLGDDFSLDDLTPDDVRYGAAARKLSDIYLTYECQDGWRDVALEDGTPLQRPEPWSLALLLRDPIIRAAIMAVVNARIHAETSEGNGSPALPNGGAGIKDGAHVAAPMTSLAPAANGSPAKTLN